MKEHIKFMKTRFGARAPGTNHIGDAGYDLFTAEDTVVHGARSVTNIPTGICVEPPPNVWLYLCARSSTLDKYGLHVWPGVIDSGYRGELLIRVSCIIGVEAVNVPAGSRLAQIIPHYVMDVRWNIVDKLSDSGRGNNGFGSTGR